MPSKADLKILLSKVPEIPRPKVWAEQYKTPPSIASEIIHFAWMQGDVEGKRVADLGTGTGIFAIGSSFMGADVSVGFDIDMEALRLAKRFCKEFGIYAEFVLQDVRTIRGNFDTVIMNPPFGSKRRGADVAFLRSAMRISKVIYSMHNYRTYEFLKKYISKQGWEITHSYVVEFPIKMSYPFHKRDLVLVKVIVLRIRRGEGTGCSNSFQ